MPRLFKFLFVGVLVGVGFVSFGQKTSVDQSKEEDGTESPSKLDTAQEKRDSLSDAPLNGVERNSKKNGEHTSSGNLPNATEPPPESKGTDQRSPKKKVTTSEKTPPPNREQND